jgi:hypothetical protein
MQGILWTQRRNHRPGVWGQASLYRGRYGETETLHMRGGQPGKGQGKESSNSLQKTQHV